MIVFAYKDSFFGGHHEAANKVNLELRAEVSSLRSFVSDGSSDELHDSAQRLRELPSYLWSDNSGTIENGKLNMNHS